MKRNSVLNSIALNGSMIAMREKQPNFFLSEREIYFTKEHKKDILN